ncbi:MAG: hypothetical protein OXU37_04065 [Thaumarchaeota archaeon]|nr:hypothetical protein [Nitrososphaerota archaeon]
MASARAACLVAAAFSVAAVLAAGVPLAHATPPAIPCGFECKWPVGTYLIPERIEAGEEFKVSWSYSWDPQDVRAAVAEAEGAPDGHYKVPGEAADTPPPGYAGSAVTLRLPHELEVVGWKEAGLDREMLWTDHYGRTMYEYTGTNAYAAAGRHGASITVRLAGDGVFYPVTMLSVDLGLSVSDSPPMTLFAVRDESGVVLSGERPSAAGAAGAAGTVDEHPHRQSLKLPKPHVKATGVPAGAAGAAGASETYVYGYLQYSDRTGVSRPAVGVRACVYDVGATASDLTLLREGAACAQTAGDGFYGIAVPREDPDGDGDADILVRFTTESGAVTTRTGGAVEGFGPAYLYDQRGPEAPLGATLAMGSAIVPDTVPFSFALGVHAPIWEAHRYFVDTFGYDVPHVTVVNDQTRGGYYRPYTRNVHMPVYPDSGGYHPDWVALHEYGHHILHILVGRLPVECRIHNFHLRTSDLCAFDEGWASFVPAVVSGDPNTEVGPTFEWNLERAESLHGALGDLPARGSDVEGTVMAILWDIYDGHGSESADDIDSKIQLVWDVLRDAPERGERYSSMSIRDFADDWDDAGYPSLDGVLGHNGVHVHGGATMQVLLGSGAAGVGDAAVLATAGQVIRVAVRAQDGERPSISFYGGAAAPMSQLAGGWWAGDHTVTRTTPNGPVRFVVSVGGAATHTLHDVNPASRVTVDRTAPPAPTAEFTAPDTIALAFLEPLAPFEDGAFAVIPPSGSAPSVRASLARPAHIGLSGDGRTHVRLSLEPAASAGGEWRVSIPASVTDAAGNAYAGGDVAVGFGADSDPPTFSARRVGDMHIAVEFNEDIRPGEWQPRIQRHFVLASSGAPGSSISPWLAYHDWPNRRVTLVFAENVFAGTLTFSDADGAGPVEDALGNRLADGTSAPVSDVIFPAFRVLQRGSDDYVTVVWDKRVFGTTSVSEWTVNGENPAGFGRKPGVETRGGGAEMELYVGGRACDGGRIQVEYTRPDDEDVSDDDFEDINTLLVDSGRREQQFSMGASSPCREIKSTGARFLDDRTISLELEGAVWGGDGRFSVAGLGETIAFVEHGARTAILHTSDAATAGATYSIGGDRSLVGLDEILAGVRVQESATYMDTAPPSVRRAEIVAYQSFGRPVPTHVAIYLSKPLDASTLAGKEFTSTTLGEITASYVAHERALVIGHQGEVGSGPHSITIPAGIRGVSGGALEPQVVMAKLRPEVTVGEPRFVDGRTLTLETGARLSAATLNGISIYPGLGSITPSQSGNTVTLSTEKHAVHNTEYTVRLPRNPLGSDGGGVPDPSLMATYTDTVRPAVTGARFVSPRAIEVSISEPLDPTTLAGAPFGVEPTLGALEAEYAAGAMSVTVRASEAARPGVPYTLVAPGAARDPAGLALVALRVPVTRPGTFLGDAAFASPSTVVLEASAPLDASTVAGIEVVGLGSTTASYDPASRTVEARTARAAADGATHRVLVPASVLDASGAAVGPMVLEATHGVAAGAPRILGASTAAAGHIRVSLDRDAAPAGGSPGSLDASLWAVIPAGGTGATPTRAVALGSDVWLLHAAAPAGTALTVSYTPGGGDGDVADRKTRQGRLAATTLPVKDMIPPTFSARTHSLTVTVVTLDKAASGGTSAAEWAVEGAEVTGVSALAAGAAPASGSPTATLGAGAERIALHHTRINPDATPAVSYSPAQGGKILAGGAMDAGSAVAADGVAPSVVAAAFAGPRTLHVELNERPDAGAAATGAFTVAGPGDSVVGVAGASAASHSATITLTLSTSVTAGGHTVTAGSTVMDLAGNGVAAGARAATASWADSSDGAPSFAARTSSLTSTVVTFTPAVTGSTSAASWSVSGAPATGIIRVGDAAVTDPGAALVSLPGGTASLVLAHAPLHGTAAEPIVRHTGTGITSGGASLGGIAAKASDGTGPRPVLAFGRISHTIVHISEPVSFVGDSEDARKSRWTTTERRSEGVVQIHPDVVRLDSSRDDFIFLDGHPVFTGGEAPLSYSWAGAEAGAVVDKSGNGMGSFSEIPTDDRFAPAFRPVHLQGLMRVHTNEPVAFVPGEIPAFVFVGEDGVRVGTYKVGPSATVDVSIDPPLIVGHEYTAHAPGFTDLSGNAYGGDSMTFIFRGGVLAHQILESDPPTVDSARFAGSREVRVEFSEPLAAVPAGAAFTVTPAVGEAIPLAANGVSHEVGLSTVTLLLSKNASPGAHEVRVPVTVADLVGNAYATPSVPVPATYDAMAPTAVSAAFTGERTATLTVSEALDAASVGAISVRGLGATSVSYTAGSTTVALHTQLPAAAGSSHAVVIPAGVTDANGVPLAPAVLWAARADTAAPAAIGARTVSPTATEVDFGEAVRLGDSPTQQQHAAHWTVTEAGSARAVTGAEVVRGGLSVRLTHAAVGASAAPSVAYVAGDSNDAASVRDWAATPNYMASTTMDVAVGDGLPPSIDTLTMSVSRPGEEAAPGRVWARAGDMVRFVMSMSEAAGTDAPAIRVAGSAHDMAASGEGRLAWTHSHAVGMGAEQGVLAFVVSASDGGGNFAHAVAPTSGVAVMVDTIMPTFTARTLGAGLVEVTLSEPVRGTITASEWTVGGAPATGVAASASSAPRAAATLDAGAVFVLWHGGGGTGSAPEVRYGPPGSA